MDETTQRTDTERRMPLARAIGREIRERAEAIERLEARRGVFSDAAEAQRLDSELSMHRRELRQATKELERLGFEADMVHSFATRSPGLGGGGALDDTQFHPISHSS